MGIHWRRPSRNPCSSRATVPDRLLPTQDLDASGVQTIDRESRKAMSRWTKFARALTEPRQGASADGRTIGLGLATALAEQRKDAEAVAAVAKTFHCHTKDRDAEGRPIHG